MLCRRSDTVAQMPSSSSRVVDPFEDFVIDLRRRHVGGSYAVAMRTAEILRAFISNFSGNSPARMVKRLKEIAACLTAAAPTEVAVENVVRRVIFLVRRQFAECKAEMEAEYQTETPVHEPTVRRTRSLTKVGRVICRRYSYC